MDNESKKYRRVNIIYVILLIVLWIPSFFGAMFLMDSLQEWYFTRNLAPSESFYSNGGKFTVIPNMFLLLLIIGYLLLIFLARLFKVSVDEISQKSFQASKQAGASLIIPGTNKQLKSSEHAKQIIKIMAVILVPLCLIANILLFNIYTKTTEAHFINRNFFQQTKKYTWGDLEKITYEELEDGDPWYELFFSNNRLVRISSYLSNPDSKAIAEFASEKSGIPIKTIKGF